MFGPVQKAMAAILGLGPGRTEGRRSRRPLKDRVHCAVGMSGRIGIKGFPSPEIMKPGHLLSLQGLLS